MVDVTNEDALYRFVDGECSPSEELEILRAERNDADLARRIREMREQNATLRLAMNVELLSELRNDIVQTAKEAHEQNALPSRISELGYYRALLTAACLVAAIGLGTGWSHWRINTWQDKVSTLAAEREAALALVVQQGLESYLSGETFELDYSDLDFVAVVRPDETYKSTSGHWCRGFTERLKIGGKEIERQAVACRDGNAKNWMRMQTVTNGPIDVNLLFSDLSSL
ncbi:hypothetical protein ACFMBG_08695 [Leisingera sp. D0M16]|uniref:hypothetical protein n=1 Tax=Leisingera coralii TaxID=3351347 RepID=UPI003B7DD9FB